MQGFEGSMIILLRVFVGSELHTHFRLLRVDGGDVRIHAMYPP